MSCRSNINNLVWLCFTNLAGGDVLLFYSSDTTYHYACQLWESLDKGESEVSMISDAEITINVQLFKKMRDIIFFLRDHNFLSHFKGHFEGAKTFLTP